MFTERTPWADEQCACWFVLWDPERQISEEREGPLLGTCPFSQARLGLL